MAKCHIIVFVSRLRLAPFCTRPGIWRPFLHEPPYVTILHTVMALPGYDIVVVTNCPLVIPRVGMGSKVKIVKADSPANMLRKAARARGRKRKDNTLLVDAAAPFVEPATLIRLLNRLRNGAAIAVLQGGGAIGFAQSEFRRLVRQHSHAFTLNFPALCTRLKRMGQLSSDGYAVVAANVHERVLRRKTEMLESWQAHQHQSARELLAKGVQLIHPSSLQIRGDITFARNVTIDANVILRGKVTLRAGVTIGPNCIIENAEIGRGVTIKEFTTIIGAKIGPACRLGPYARIRPGTKLGVACQIGNFVEIKSSTLGTACKINHHSFIGDAELGDRVIIGAGTITCNYDGMKTNRTVVRNGAFIGSGVMLIAPVTVGRRAIIGAGSVVTKSAPSNSLTLTRAKQISIARWRFPKLNSKTLLSGH